MAILNLYYPFFSILVVVLFSFFTIKFIINFFRINGIKSLSTIFKKDNKFILIIILIFTIVFWFSFYNIFYIRVYPSLNISETVENAKSTNVYTDGCVVGYDCETIRVNITSPKEIKLEITNYSRNFITFKLNTPMYLKECENCSLKLLNPNEEYKLLLNKQIFIEDLENDISNKVYYNISLH